MSKELDKVKEIRDKVLYNADGYATLPIGEVNLLISIANKSLQRLEAIDNAEPSEALECLEFICKILNEKRIDVKWLFKNDYNTIKQALIKAEKEHKALEIIKEKNVSIFQLSCCKNVNEYNDLKFKDSEKLTEEEFSLLKEMLGC